MYEAESRSSQKFKQTLQGIQRKMLPVLSKFWIALVNIGRNRAAILPGHNMFLTDCLLIKYESLSIHQIRDKLRQYLSILSNLSTQGNKSNFGDEINCCLPQISSL